MPTPVLVIICLYATYFITVLIQIDRQIYRRAKKIRKGMNNESRKKRAQ